ncbi:MAG: hypothetical protein LBP53_02705 [Candidatus Peribacteria bacterium]|nr:hypothetical protein [Candidatus Peribacteria bacterium]
MKELLELITTTEQELFSPSAEVWIRERLVNIFYNIATLTLITTQETLYKEL